MKTKLLLLIALSAVQCGFTSFAMDNRQPALQPNTRLSLYQTTAGAFLLHNQARCGVQSSFYGLTTDDSRRICDYLNDLIYHCSDCNFQTFDKNALDIHMNTHVYPCYYDGCHFVGNTQACVAHIASKHMIAILDCL